MTQQKLTRLEARLNDFDSAVRRDSLAACAALYDTPASAGQDVALNMHIHSFFSYNAAGWSPSRIAWEAHKAGWYAAALCDFDLLDGLDEFLAAARVVALRAAVHLETRAFVSEWHDRVINSPGEPGVAYVMGAGFYSRPAPDSPEAVQLEQMRQAAQERNAGLIERINRAVPQISIDLARDVKPLTPAGMPTERHIIAAYVVRATRRFGNEQRRAAFWSPLLRLEPAECCALWQDGPAFEERVRAALAKEGAPGYLAPSPASFPKLDDFITWVRHCHAIPMIAWLDGTSAGESDCDELLDTFRDKGCAALNIIPERNWRGGDDASRERRIAQLDAVINAAQARDMPLNIGTEMNRRGLPPADDLAGPVLSRYRDAFIKGARIMVGHTTLALFADMPYAGPRATALFAQPAQRNNFFAAIGALPPITHEVADQLFDAGPERALALLVDQVKKMTAHQR